MVEGIAARGLAEDLTRSRKHCGELRAEIESLQAIADRPLDDDLNVLLGRCDDKEPLSLAEQEELYAWLNEKDVIMGEALEKAEGLQAEQVKLKQGIVAASGLLLAATGPEDGPTNWVDTRQRWLDIFINDTESEE